MNFNLVKAGLVASVSMLAVACSSATATVPQDSAQDVDLKNRHVMIERAGDHDVHVKKDIRVEVDKDGNKKVWINGEEASEEELAKFEKGNNRVFIAKAGKDLNWVSKGENNFFVHAAPKNSFVWKSDDGEKVKIKIEEKDGEKKIWINGEEGTEEDLAKYEAKHEAMMGKMVKLRKMKKLDKPYGISENEFVFITKDGDKAEEIKVKKDKDGNIWINGEKATEEDLAKLKEKHGLHMMPVMAGKMAFIGKGHGPRIAHRVVRAPKPMHELKVARIARESANASLAKSLEKVRIQLDAAEARNDKEAVSALKEALEALKTAKESMAPAHIVMDLKAPDLEKVIIAELGELRMEEAELGKMRVELHSELADAREEIAEAMAEIEMEVEANGEEREYHIRVLKQASEDMAEAEEHQLEALKHAEEELRRTREELERKLQARKEKESVESDEDN